MQLSRALFDGDTSIHHELINTLIQISTVGAKFPHGLNRSSLSRRRARRGNDK